MKFACDRCGRSYAVADELQGRAFKMKCKACGHLIVVKAAAERPPAPPAARASPMPDGEPTATSPDVNPFAVAPVSAAAAAEALQASPLTHEALGAGPPADAPGRSPAPPGEPAAAKRPEGSSVDIAPDERIPSREGAQAGAASPPAGGDFEDPFAGWKPFDGEEEARAGPPPLPARARPAASARPAGRIPGATGVPATPRSGTAQRLGMGPKLLLAGGALAIVAIAVVVVATGRGGGGRVEPATPRAVPSTAAAPERRAEAAPSAPPIDTPAPAEAEPAAPGPAEQPGLDLTPKEQVRKQRATEGRPRRERAARVPKEERPAEPEQAPPLPVPGRPAAAVAAASPPAPATTATSGPPSADQIAVIARANSKAFEACMAEAVRLDPNLDLNGREVVLTLSVNPNGVVAYATLDDAELAKTDLGTCLKSAAQAMVFPAFEGPLMKVEVPLALGGK